MNFLVCEMTFLRYFIPLTIEGNKRGIKSKYFTKANGKYTNPDKYKAYLTQLSVTYNFELYNIDKVGEYTGVTFMIEGCGVEHLHTNHTKVSLSYLTDFTLSYPRYIDKVDYSILPNLKFAETYNRTHEKNLYLGSPKYDVVIDEKETLKKYNLPESPKALIMYPRSRDVGKINLTRVYNWLKDLGYTIIVKSRGKDPAQQLNRGDHYFEDRSWYPHTSMELMQVSDILINFDSTSIKEATMLRVPVINFSIKPFNLLLPWLYEYDHVKNLPVEIPETKFKATVKGLITKDHTESFDRSIKENMFQNNTSNRILNKLT